MMMYVASDAQLSVNTPAAYTTARYNLCCRTQPVFAEICCCCNQHRWRQHICRMCVSARFIQCVVMWQCVIRHIQQSWRGWGEFPAGAAITKGFPLAEAAAAGGGAQQDCQYCAQGKQWRPCISSALGDAEISLPTRYTTPYILSISTQKRLLTQSVSRVFFVGKGFQS